jgi:hypothetical protein
MISVPVLVAKLTASGDNSSAIALKSQFFPDNDALVVTSADVDHPENVVTPVVPSVPLRDLRESSYAGIFYLDLRCGLVHEYRLPIYMKGLRHGERVDVPSYFNLTVEPDPALVKRVSKQYAISERQASVTLARIRRHLHLPYQYVRDALKAVAGEVFDSWDSAATWSRQQPAKWWIEG